MEPELDWWQKAIIYEIFISSFKDSNKDGVGDLRGIIEKLDYLQSLGVTTLWLSPFYPSGGKDGGYDLTSFVDIDPLFGTMNDFDELVEKVHQRGMYILIDFIPNHTSINHKWFVESSKDNRLDNPYRDYYVWYPSHDKVNPPNNWPSVFGHSGWTYNETRKAWYYHQFLPEQPDLNYRCEAVHKEMRDVIRFWLDTKKVDGFRIDAFKHLYESEEFENESIWPWCKNYLREHGKEPTYNDFDHYYTTNQEGTFDVLYEWRCLWDEIGKKQKSTKILVVEATYDVKDIGPYYKHNDKLMAHLPNNFQFCHIKQESPSHTPDEWKHLSNHDIFNRSFIPLNIKRLVEEYYIFKPNDCWSNWQLSNHDNERAATRFGHKNIDIANALNLLLDGTALVYYGEELGMENIPKSLLKFEDARDEFGRRFGPDLYLHYTRDFYRAPMQWNSDENTGFTDEKNIKPWLPVHPNHKKINVEQQLKEENSHLKIVMDLIKLRQIASFKWGKLKLFLINENLFSFIRHADGHKPHLVLMNISDLNIKVNLKEDEQVSSLPEDRRVNDMPSQANVVYYITNNNKSNQELPAELAEQNENENNHNEHNSSSNESIYKINDLISTENVYLKAHDCLILNW